MLELYLSKVTETSESEQAGKYYARVSYKQVLDVKAMAHHMAEHNTKATVEANGLEMLYDADADKVASASLGTLADGAKTGPAVKTVKLLAQSTGDFTREELKKDVKLSWTDKAKAEIAEAKGTTSGESGNSGSSNSGNSGSGSNSVTPNNGSEQSSTLAAPTISGTTPFAETTSVSMSGPDGAEIHYTTDGSVPTAESTLYSEAFTLSDTTTVKAIAIKDGESSEVASKLFTKGEGDDEMDQN